MRYAVSETPRSQRAEVIGQMRAGVRDSAVLVSVLAAYEKMLAAHFEPECC